MFSNIYYTLACRTEGGFWLISGKWRERETSAKSDKRASKGTRKLNTFHAHAAPFALVSRVTLRSLSSQTNASSVEKRTKQTFFDLLCLTFRI